MRRVGRSVRGNVCGLTFLFTPACVEAMQCGSVVQHVRNGVATIKTEKTGTEVTLPILPVLSRTLEAGPCGDLTFIAGENGHPLTKKSFGNLFRKACRAAGLQRTLCTRIA